jgi:shikimate kinase
MATVVLLGFSTTGKSTILRDFAAKYSSHNLETIDTDKRILIPDYAATEQDAHIYIVFNQLVRGQDRDEALTYIERREREILETLQQVNNPQLIAAGPALASREPQWAEFIKRVNPTCFYLEKTAEEVYEGLLDRRSDENKVPKEIRERVDFGSWDDNVITKYEDGKWIEVSKDRAIENIKREMQQLVRIYEAHSSGGKYNSLDLQNISAVKEQFYDRIREALGLPE